MPHIRDIRKFAAEIERRAKHRSIYLKHELAEVESRKAEIEAHWSEPLGSSNDGQSPGDI
jgi:hypothetical protein